MVVSFASRFFVGLRSDAGPAPSKARALGVLAAFAAAASVVVTAGCPSADADGPAPEATLPPLEILDGCQPLAHEFDCTLPYPSDFFRHESEDGGHTVALEGEARIFTAEGFSATITDWRKPDGFSALPTITFVLGPALDRSGATSIFDDPIASTLPGHNTILLDVERGEAVPHFVDFDGATEPGPRQAVQIRPLVPLRWDTRYVVAVQHMNGADGERVDAPEGFARLRDGTSGDDPALLDQNRRFAGEVFGPLAAFGVDVGELQLAWDFTTGSESFATDDMFRTRELVLAELAANPPQVEVTGVIDGQADEPRIWRTVYGVVTGPMVTETDQAGAELARDEDGRVRLNGTATFPFTAKIPYRMRDQFEAGPALLYGHGFFGSRDEVEVTSTRRLAHETTSMAIAIDWWGMSINDLGVVVSDLGNSQDATKALRFTDRVPQAMANWLSLTHALKEQLHTDPAFTRSEDPTADDVVEDPSNPGVTNAGEPLYDPTRLNFAGMSMGHILGGVMVALNADVERAVFNVGGAGFTQMMSRALPFERFLFVLDVSVPENLDQMKMASTMQRFFDRIDPYVFAPYLLQRDVPIGPPSGSGQRRVLQQMGVGDTSVPNFASLIHARAMGLPLVGPQPIEAFGLEQAESLAPSGLTVFDYSVDTSFYEVATPATEANGVHDVVRSTDQALEQMRLFFETGEVVHPCDGPCLFASP